MNRLVLAAIAAAAVASLAACDGGQPQPENLYHSGYSYGYHNANSKFLRWANQNPDKNVDDWCNQLDPYNSAQWVKGCAAGVRYSA
jgi:hypothetical protein